MNRYRLLYFIGFILFLYQCSSSDKAQLQKKQVSYLDSLLGESARPKYWNFPEYPTRVETWKLVHQRIHLQLFPERDSIKGFTDITVVNKRTGQDILSLDALGLAIQRVSEIKSGTELTVEADSNSIRISLPKKKFKDDTVFVRVEYSVKGPAEGIRSMYSQNYYTNVPLRIYSDNQPEDIRTWLPTLDSPAQRATFELWLNYPDRLTSLATGIMIESVGEGNGRKTDYWVLRQAQAPYLWGFFIGNTAVSRKLFNKKLLEFHTDSEFESYHKLIYSGVDTMLYFLENLTGMKYPYDVLRFVPVPDYDAMGMENTGMITLFDQVQFDSSMVGEISNTDLLIHEMAHHWFGNWVTVQEWGEIALQEGLATWTELAYADFQLGEDAMIEKKWFNLMQILTEQDRYRRAIVTKNFVQPKDLFDSHSYEKASLVFDLLRHTLGNEAFKQVLQDWVSVPKESVSFATFQRLAEQQYGKPLDTFFQQWFFEPGLPELHLRFDSDPSQTRIYVSQRQPEKEPVYDLSITLLAVRAEQVDTLRFRFFKRDTVLFLNKTYQDIWIDPNFTIPAKINQPVTESQWKLRLEKAPLYIVLQTMYQTEEDELGDELVTVFKHHIVTNPKPLIREWANKILASNYTIQDRDFHLNIMKSSQPGRVRMYSVFALSEDESSQIDSVFVSWYPIETNVFIKAELLKIGLQRSVEQWMDYAQQAINIPSYQHIYRSAVVHGLYANSHPKAVDLLLELTRPRHKAVYMYDALEALISQQEWKEDELAERALAEILKDKTDDPDISIKWLAYRQLYGMNNYRVWVEEKIAELPQEEGESIRSMIQQSLELVLPTEPQSKGKN